MLWAISSLMRHTSSMISSAIAASSINSSGVQISGTTYPHSRQIFRMTGFVSALSRCRQFHVRQVVQTVHRRHGHVQRIALGPRRAERRPTSDSGQLGRHLRNRQKGNIRQRRKPPRRRPDIPTPRLIDRDPRRVKNKPVALRPPPVRRDLLPCGRHQVTRGPRSQVRHNRGSRCRPSFSSSRLDPLHPTPSIFHPQAILDVVVDDETQFLVREAVVGPSNR